MKLGLRELLFGLLLLGLPVGAWWFVFRPSNIQHAEIRKQIESKQAKLRTLDRLVSTVGSLKNQISSLEQAIASFQAKLPNEKEMDHVLKDTWRLAEDNNLVTKSIRAAQRGKKSSVYASGSYAEQPILMKLQGDFDGFYAFLQALERQPRIMRISHMKLEKLSKGKEGLVIADFEISVFFEHENKDSG